MRILIDMNLSPRWVEVLRQAGWEAKHWVDVGDPRAPDRIIMEWARESGYFVFTHDLDFGTALALTHAQGPSVIQVRAQNVSPAHLSDVVVEAIRQCERQLLAGALVTVDEARTRVRVLPIGR